MLPAKLWFNIFEHLNDIDRIIFRRVCKQWNEIIKLLLLETSALEIPINCSNEAFASTSRSTGVNIYELQKSSEVFEFYQTFSPNIQQILIKPWSHMRFSSLLNVLKNCPMIVRLEIYRNTIILGQKNEKFAILNGVAANLTTVILHRPTFVVDVSGRCLRFLVIGQSEAAAEMVNSISALPRVDSLDFQNMSIPSKAFSTLCPAIGSRLRRFCWKERDCRVTKSVLLKSIENLTGLTHLNLGGFRANSDKDSTHLIDAELLNAIAAYCKQLEALCLKLCSEIRDNGLLEIVALPNLRYLMLAKCKNLSEKFLPNIYSAATVTRRKLLTIHAFGTNLMDYKDDLLIINCNIDAPLSQYWGENEMND